MAKLHDKSSAKQSGATDPEILRRSVQTFLSTCKRPAVLDFGDQPIELQIGQHCLEIRSGRLSVEAWNEERSLSRRILSVQRGSAGVLDCVVQHFGGTTGKLSFLDLAKPQTALRFAKAERQSFAEQFRRMLHRQFPGWEIDGLSSAMDLRRSFSTAFPRARLHRRNQYLAALACPSRDEEAEFLSSAILWFDHLFRSIGSGGQLSLCLFLPEGAGNMTAQRLQWLTGRTLHGRIFLFNEHGMAGQVDLRDLGNLETSLTARFPGELPSPELQRELARLAEIPGIGFCREPGGSISIRFRGLEFATVEGARVRLGIEYKEELPSSQIERLRSFARQLAELGQAEQPSLPAYSERWFESQVRGNVQLLDADLLESPIHGQVLTFAGGNRELIDLLGISAAGRLTILELKTAPDIHLPIQSLDYWMRVKWHAERRELGALFPTIELAIEPPKLMLVAPALSFHSSNEIVLRYFSPDIEVERVGVNSDWELGFRVVLRLRGADVPISHRGFDETRRFDQYQEGDHDAQPE